MESAAHGKSANKIHFFTATSTWSDYSKTVPAMYTSKNFTANNDGLPSKIIHRKHQLSTASWHNRKLKIRRNVVVITWLLFAFGFCARRGLSREMLTPPLLMQNSPVDTHKSHTRSICKHHTHTHTCTDTFLPYAGWVSSCETFCFVSLMLYQRNSRNAEGLSLCSCPSSFLFSLFPRACPSDNHNETHKHNVSILHVTRVDNPCKYIGNPCL